MKAATGTLAEVLRAHETDILDDWMVEQQKALTRSRDKINDAELRSDSSRFLRAFVDALQSGGTNIDAEAWKGAREALAEVTATRARRGFTPSETATFVFSLKQPVFTRLRKELVSKPLELA